MDQLCFSRVLPGFGLGAAYPHPQTTGIRFLPYEAHPNTREPTGRAPQSRPVGANIE